MPAKHLPVSAPAHDAERRAIRFIVEGLPDTYTCYSNAWLTERPGAPVYELDLVVCAPHAIFVVEIKSFRGLITGNDHDWSIPELIRSPLKLNRKTAQILAERLRRTTFDAGNVWVEGFVFLSDTTDVRMTGDASRHRVHTRATILDALTNPALIAALSGRPAPTAPARTRQALPVTADLRDVLDRLLLQADRSSRPPAKIRSYLLRATLERSDHFIEYLAQNELNGRPAVLRVYPLPDPLADDALRTRQEARFRWEAQVLARVGHHEHVLHADAPFIDEAGLCLPFEHFPGISLATWIDKYHARLRGKASLTARVTLWKKLVAAIEHAHNQGVIHRLLRPEVILVEDKTLDTDHPDSAAHQPAVRVTGFDLAKQLSPAASAPSSSVTIGFLSTALSDDRVLFAAPEVIQSFSSATRASDQFSLGVILGLLLAGRPLFTSTAEYKRRGGFVTRLRDLSPYIPQSLDEAVATLLALEPARRYPSLDAAVLAIDNAVDPRLARAPRALPNLQPLAALDPEDLPERTRLGTDYEILHKLGQGGMATVYAARHLVSGKTRALKVARPDASAVAALEAEERALSTLDHANIVRAIDITNVVPDRKTLVLERIHGQPLSTWLASTSDPSPLVLRRLADDLLAALVYLEERGVTHKDIKPDNLIASDETGLTVIDFSLVDLPADQTDIGTARYRDPALTLWTHAADRYAAALCLFELYEGRHAFDDTAPPPDVPPSLDPADLDHPELAPFFHKALHPRPERRFPSAVAMRQAFQQAHPPVAAPTAPSSPIAPTLQSLDPSALAVLRRAGINTAHELAALGEDQVRALRGLGTQKRRAVLELRQALLAAGLDAPGEAGPSGLTGPAPHTPWPTSARAPQLAPALIGDPTPVHRMGLPTATADKLERAGLTTVGHIAAATRAELTSLTGLTDRKLAPIAEALHRLEASRAAADLAAPGALRTLDALWSQATGPLPGRQPDLIAWLTGHTPLPGADHPTPNPTQEALAAASGLSQAHISRELRKALETVDRNALIEVMTTLDLVLDRAGGIETLAEAARELDTHFPGAHSPQGARPEVAHALIDLVVRLEPTRIQRFHLDDANGQLLTRPWCTPGALQAFIAETHKLAREWPPVAPDTARASLRSFLPEYTLDPLVLAERIVDGVMLTGVHAQALGGALFEPPIAPELAIPYVLRHLRPPVDLRDLQREVEATFGPAVVWPGPSEVHRIVKEKLPELSVEGETIRGGGVEARPSRRPDALPPELMASRTPEVVVGDLLREAARSRGFRIVVTPPERHPEIGRSIAQALGEDTTWLSFEDQFLARIDPQFSLYERAERFSAQRGLLTEEAEALVDELLREHGHPGRRIVLGDTALLEPCDALHLLRTLYDRTMSGAQGFWVVVMPGLIHQRQPLFNERTPTFHVDGTVLPLASPIPVAA